MKLRFFVLAVLLLAVAGIAQAQGTDKHSISLACTASTSPNITGYNFYRGTVSGGPYAKLNSALVSTCSYTGHHRHRRRHLFLRGHRRGFQQQRIRFFQRVECNFFRHSRRAHEF
jgi:hypothetical protein